MTDFSTCTVCDAPHPYGTPHKQTIWALKHADGTWRAPDHFASSRTADPKKAKPFYGPSGRHDAGLFQQLAKGYDVVLHPHPEVWRP